MQHALSPHPSTPPSADIRIEAGIVRAGGRIALTYVVTGEIERLLIPALRLSKRTDGLWRTTCFEAFLKGAAADAYVELNLAPSGQWAAYRFTSPREGVRPADLASPPRIEAALRADRFEIGAAMAVGGFPPAEGPWLVGLTAVIEETDGAKSYFALAHPSGKPDFHDSRGFALEVPA